MAGRPSVDIVSQFGIEVTPGLPVVANRFLPTISLTPKIKRETKQFRAQGSKYNTSSVVHKKHADGGFDGVLDYNSIIYPLACLLPPPTPAAISSSLAQLWAFRPNSKALDNPKTITIEKGDANGAERYAYGQLTSLSIDWGQDDLKISGNLIARSPVPGITLTASPTEIPERPVQRGQIDVFLDSTFGAIGTTQITDAFEEKMALGDKFKAKFVHNSSVPSFKDAIEVAPSLVFSFMCEHNSQSQAILADVLQNDTIHYMRVIAQGAVIAAASSAANEVQSLTSTATGGTFTVTFVNPITNDSETTPALAFGITAAALQTALRALPNMPAAAVACTGGPLNTTPIVCTFSGALADYNIAAMVIDNTLATGGTVVVSTGTQGSGNILETIQFDIAGKFTQPDEVMDAMGSGVYAYTYNFVALADPTMGRPFSVDVRNLLTTL